MYQRLNLLEIELLLLEIKQKAIMMAVRDGKPSPFKEYLAIKIDIIENQTKMLKYRISQIRLKLFPVEDAEDL